jgi:hypothetical protein
MTTKMKIDHATARRSSLKTTRDSPKTVFCRHKDGILSPESAVPHPEVPLSHFNPKEPHTMTQRTDWLPAKRECAFAPDVPDFRDGDELATRARVDMLAEKEGMTRGPTGNN